MLHTFMGTDIEVGPGVLVPRVETELLGRTVLATLAGSTGPIVVDMCCGSGNLAIAVGVERPDAQVYGGDVSIEPIDWARRNVDRLGLSERVRFERGDMFSALAAYELEGKVDLVMANPPYISTHKLETESAHLLENEPREAFDAGPYGISLHQRLIAESQSFLKRSGWLACEFGVGQERQMKVIFARSRAFSEPQFFNDDEGRPRVVLARKL